MVLLNTLTLEEILESKHFSYILLNFEYLYPTKRAIYRKYYIYFKDNRHKKAQEFCRLCRIHKIFTY